MCRIIVVLLAAGLVVGCAGTPAAPDYVFQAQPGQGRSAPPFARRAVPTPRLPAVDPCRSQMYAGLLGVNEGAIWIPGLPGRVRVIRPAAFDGPASEFLNGEMMGETYVQVRDYLPGASLYAPAIADITDRIAIVNDAPERLTMELDAEGYVQEIRCG